MKRLTDTEKLIELWLSANKSQHKKALAIHRAVDLQTGETFYRVSESNIEILKALDGMVDKVQLLWHRQGGLTETGKAFLIEHGIDVLKYFKDGKLLHNVKATVFGEEEERKR